MRVRRAATLTGAVAALVLLGGPAWADETPVPEPTAVVVDDGDMVIDGPTGDPYCTFVPTPVESPEPEPTEEPTEEPTVDPTEDPTGGVTPDPTEGTGGEPVAEGTAEPGEGGEEPSGEPEPTGDPVGEPTQDPDGQWMCLAYTGAESAGGPASGPGRGEATLGSGVAQLPRTGAPLGHYAATGLALVLAGVGTVLLVGRRSA